MIKEIIFTVNESLDGGYEAQAVGIRYLLNLRNTARCKLHYVRRHNVILMARAKYHLLELHR